MHQRRDRVERVEQEVRLHLPLQRLQLRLDQPRLELRRVQLPRARLVVVAQRVADADDGPVGHHLPVEVQEEHLLRFVQPRVERFADDPVGGHARRRRQRHVQQRRDDDAGDVNGIAQLPRSRDRTGNARVSHRMPA